VLCECGTRTTKQKSWLTSSVADTHHFDADPDPDPDPAFHFDADPDPDPDADSDPTF
jgi:hypothetical protein